MHQGTDIPSSADTYAKITSESKNQVMEAKSTNRMKKKII